MKWLKRIFGFMFPKDRNVYDTPFCNVILKGTEHGINVMHLPDNGTCPPISTSLPCFGFVYKGNAEEIMSRQGWVEESEIISDKIRERLQEIALRRPFYDFKHYGKDWTIEELQRLEAACVEIEDYKSAALVRDEIKSREK